MCGSSLAFRPDLKDRRLQVDLVHSYHACYEDRHLPEDIVSFIDKLARRPRSTALRIWEEMQESDLPNAEYVAEYQVYNQWQVANWKLWHKQDISVKMLLAEPHLQDKFECIKFPAGHLSGLAVYVLDSISMLAAEAKELAIDATYGTNNAGMDLFAVLAEVDGTGVPLAYMFVGSSGVKDDNVTTTATKDILIQFLETLKKKGCDPTFFGCDKDKGEIGAIQSVWPGSSVQLCLWHAKRAISARLKVSHQTYTQRQYHPEEARVYVPTLEICWGCEPSRRPDGDHKAGRCDCPSKDERFPEKGRVSVASVDESNALLAIFSRHFNMHPLIPDQNGTLRSPEQIHMDCVREMYTWCRARDYFRLWAYLYVNWYTPDMWKLWSRSLVPTMIPVLKTTMIVESHWRKVKHTYLHSFNRPRIDLVVWVLTSRVVPDILKTTAAIIRGDRKFGQASWRKAFKREWKAAQSQNLDSRNLSVYKTDPAKWTCGCIAFLESRFLICKHIISCYEPIQQRHSFQFFFDIKRQRESPFWKHEKLVLRPEYRQSSIPPPPPPSESDNSDYESMSEYEVLSEYEAEPDDGEDDDPENGEDNEHPGGEEHPGDEDEQPVDEDGDENDEDQGNEAGVLPPDTLRHLSTQERYLKLLGRGRDVGDKRLLNLCAARFENPDLDQYISLCEASDRRRTMPKTWAATKYSTMMWRK